MSDAGERTCPLCAEEMDLTDQQLKPCKCGYDICVWCWNHIMDMSEKDNTEGRCPACRTPYNKEKIVGTASKCERLVTGMNVEKKQKSQKGKTKPYEGRKELGSVRVIQRNLVYIVGLPLNLADEDLLQQKEYFGQYGKVLKVSISRTAAGEIQQFPNSTCSVYITYYKEEEAVRSIQSAHGFILEGRPLRACFGTTKYCHAWLRNTPCTNADCLYLHEFGPQEDSFTKDEIVSAFTRNKVQQITGATNDMQRRSGHILPPPADDYSKPISKIASNNPANTIKVSPANTIKVSPPNSSCDRSVALPAAASWGTRASISQPVVANGASNTLSKKHCEENHNLQEKGNLGNPVSVNKTVGPNHRIPLSKALATTELSSSSTASIHLSTSPDGKNISLDTSSETTKKNRRPQPRDETHTVTSPTRKESDLVSNMQKKVSQVAIKEAEEQNPPHIMDPVSLDQNPEKAPQQPFNNISNRMFEDHCTADLDLGENTIISNILSMDFDPWDESLTSPQNLAKFLGEHNKEVLSSRKPQNNGQSRFSFARQDDCTDQGLSFAPSLSDFERGVEFNNNGIRYDNKLSNGNGFSSFSFEKPDHFATGYPKNKISVSRTQVSAPPGFSGPSRSPPPGFTVNNTSEIHNFDTLRKSHEAAATVNIGDLEFMDPAILAVGGRVPMRSNFSAHMNSFENDTRLQFLLQSSFSHQNPRFTDNYQQTSFQQHLSSLNVNGHHWNGGNDVMGFNRYYSGHEDTKFHLSTSADLYNRAFGI